MYILTKYIDEWLLIIKEVNPELPRDGYKVIDVLHDKETGSMRWKVDDEYALEDDVDILEEGDDLEKLRETACLYLL